MSTGITPFRFARSLAGRLVSRLRRESAPRGMAMSVSSERSPDKLAAFSHYIVAARALGLRQPQLFLSFDCDTDLDFDATLPLLDFLEGLGIRSTYAIPGVQIERGIHVYRQIAERGGEFINHGYLPHARWQDDRYISITWYHEMTPEAVADDMRQGDRTIRDLLGVSPKGFRAPHFGLFSQPEQLALVHKVARELGYTYCSTTLPEYGLAHGPVHDLDGLIELPTFGSLASPVSVLDSWTYLSDRRNYALSDVYGDLVIETTQAFVDQQAPALLSWYADPSHVVGQPPFERAMRHLAALQIPSLTASQAAALAGVRDN